MSAVRTADLIRELGSTWRGPIEQAKPAKFRDRPTQLAKKARLVNQALPEYRDGGCHCLDLSCGNGVLLEVLRYYGNTVLGADRNYFTFLDSQGVPYVQFDGDCLPYPFADRSFDLVTSIGAITFYQAPWPTVLGEMCRIARRTVLVEVNLGWVYDKYRGLLDQLTPQGWRLVLRQGSRYKWQRVA